LLPLACWGLLAYLGYQWLQFGEPLAFAKTQEHWQARETGGFFDKALSLASLEPIWATYTEIPRAPGWEIMWPHALFAMRFANPIYFVATAVLIALGRYKQWLTREEFWLGTTLLLIPYVTRSYEWTMLSHARFAAVAFPAYIVLGHLLCRMPDVIRTALLAFSAVVLTMYAALFAAGRDFF